MSATAAPPSGHSTPAPPGGRSYAVRIDAQPPQDVSRWLWLSSGCC